MSVAERYILEKKYMEEFVLVAGTQTKGRGRKGNDWVSPEGGLWFSYVMNHLSVQKGFTLYVGCCVVKGLVKSLEQGDGSGEMGDWRFMIKWPNDVYLDVAHPYTPPERGKKEGKKVCGLICSQFSQHNKIIVGVGINSNITQMPIDAPINSGSIQEILGVTIDNKNCLKYIMDNINDGLSEFEKHGVSVFYDFYRENDYLTGKKINVVSGNEEYCGLYAGVDEDGGLLLETEGGGVKRVYSGSVADV